MCQNAAAKFGGCAVSDKQRPGWASPVAERASSCVAAGWRSASVSSVSDASELLDRLEACGFREREFGVLGESSFEVRWR
jgi:hypothetical protein